MAGKIPQSFIDDVLDRTDIVDLIGSRVKLKKTGLNYQGLCPFHDEKTPSFSVNPSKQFYYCFGCGAGGNAISFMMDYERSDFPQTIEGLAKNIGLEVPREHNPQLEAKRKKQATLFDALSYASQFYREQLQKGPERRKAVTYLKGRGLTGEIAKQFNIGVAPDGWDKLLNSFIQNQQQLQTPQDPAKLKNLLDDAGLCIQKPEEGKCYDRFRDRLIFPIRDTRGRTIAFGGRAFGDIKPKYLNSPETAVFQKHNELYGLFEALQAKRHLTQLIMVEGYMDVVALAQFGIDWAVATLGTSAGKDHMQKVFRHTSEVVFCFDGDNAGRKAALRALDAVLPLMQAGRRAKFLFLDEGEDPDTLVRKIGKQQFLYLIEDAPSLSEFLFTHLSEDLQLNRADDKAEFIHRLGPKAALLQDGSFKSLLIADLADKAGISADKLEQFIRESEAQFKAESKQEFKQETNTARPGQTTNNSEQYSNQGYHQDHHQDFDPSASPVHRKAFTREQKEEIQLKSRNNPATTACALALFFPEAVKQQAPKLPFSSDEIDNDNELKLLNDIIKNILEQERPNSATLIGSWLAKSPEKISNFLAYPLNLDNTELHSDEFADAIKQLERKKHKENRQNTISTLEQNKSLSELSSEQQAAFLAIFQQDTDKPEDPDQTADQTAD